MTMVNSGLKGLNGAFISTAVIFVIQVYVFCSHSLTILVYMMCYQTMFYWELLLNLCAPPPPTRITKLRAPDLSLGKYFYQRVYIYTAAIIVLCIATEGYTNLTL